MKAQQRLREDFLSPYYEKGDCFPNLLARSTYVSKYARDNEVWTDTIRRVVDGNCDIDPNISMKERELLFHAFWTMQALPPGRGLWVGGIDAIPAEARFNCYYTTVYDYLDWEWTANMLMLGGGVGVGLSELSSLPTISKRSSAFAVVCNPSHPNADEVKANFDFFHERGGVTEVLEDSREGWVYGLHRVFDSAFNGTELSLDVSRIRPRGALIKTFGGIACGPGPLVSMLRSVWNVVRGAAGRKINSVEGLDITNFIGKCIKSGNVRRSALIALGQPMDQAFRDAKKDFSAVMSHRHTSNNSICFRHYNEFEGFDWEGLVNDNIEFGEPGILNLALGRRTDPGAMGVNPCGEQLLHDREACNLAEVFPANFDGSIEKEVVFQLVARYCLRQRLTPLKLDNRTQEVAQRNMRVGVGLGGICDFTWDESLLSRWFTAVRHACDDYARELNVSRPITTTTVKPSGTISLLCGSSPGLHAPFAPYYIRRTRHAINDPMTATLIEAGVPWEYDQYDNTGKTVCFSFPMKAKHTKTTVQTQTLLDQFERQLAVQNSWADNAVSCTISFDKDRPHELAAALRQYAPQLKSTSCLPKTHGYVQAPYEEINEAKFAELAGTINFDAKLVKGELDIEECSGGACPIR
jgi:ribonucleotide reductase alpha subunit